MNINIGWETFIFFKKGSWGRTLYLNSCDSEYLKRIWQAHSIHETEVHTETGFPISGGPSNSISYVKASNVWEFTIIPEAKITDDVI